MSYNIIDIFIYIMLVFKLDYLESKYILILSLFNCVVVFMFSNYQNIINIQSFHLFIFIILFTLNNYET